MTPVKLYVQFYSTTCSLLNYLIKMKTDAILLQVRKYYQQQIPEILYLYGPVYLPTKAKMITEGLH